MWLYKDESVQNRAEKQKRVPSWGLSCWSWGSVSATSTFKSIRFKTDDVQRILIHEATLKKWSYHGRGAQPSCECYPPRLDQRDWWFFIWNLTATFRVNKLSTKHSGIASSAKQELNLSDLFSLYVIYLQAMDSGLLFSTFTWTSMKKSPKLKKKKKEKIPTLQMWTGGQRYSSQGKTALW